MSVDCIAPINQKTFGYSVCRLKSFGYSIYRLKILRLKAEAITGRFELFNIMLIMQCLRRRSGCCIIAFALCYIATLRLRLPLPTFGSKIQTKSQSSFCLVYASRRQVPNHSRSYFPLLSLGTCALR